MRWAAAMGAPRVLIWEGRVARREDVDAACGTLAQAIEAAGQRSGLADPPPVSCELHPFTFALKYRALPELATALRSVGAGICFDFCHFGVALGRDLLAHLDDDVVEAIDHVHFSDTDTKTSELHFPLGRRRARPRCDRRADCREADRLELGSVRLARAAPCGARPHGCLSRLRRAPRGKRAATELMPAMPPPA